MTVIAVGHRSEGILVPVDAALPVKVAEYPVLIQAERLGTSMGKTLKSQADNIRERRRQYVKAEALKAPVKIVFPLVLFIFPAIFVVTLVPTLLFLMKSM